VLSAPTDAREWVALTDAELPVDALHAWAATPRSGAVVCFVGVVRDHAEGRDGVRAMTYEAYDEPARRVMNEIVTDARRRWPDLERIALLHRVGRLQLSEGLIAASRSGVRCRALLHRHVERDRAHLEAGALAGRQCLGAR
jgi:molybdopterin synthase catalytic subunit